MANMMMMAQLAQMMGTPAGRRMVAQNAAARGITAEQIAQAASPQPAGLGPQIAGPPAIPQMIAGPPAIPPATPAAVAPQAPAPAAPTPAESDPQIQALLQAASAVQPPAQPQRPVLQPTLPRRGDVNISQAGVADLATLMNLAQQTPQVPTLGSLIGGI